MTPITDRDAQANRDLLANSAIFDGYILRALGFRVIVTDRDAVAAAALQRESRERRVARAQLDQRPDGKTDGIIAAALAHTDTGDGLGLPHRRAPLLKFGPGGDFVREVWS